MGDLILKPLNALAGAAPVRVAIGTVDIAERPEVALASLACRRGQAPAVVAAALAIGLSLPGPGKASAGVPFSALWLGPEQWLVMADNTTHEDIATILAAAFGQSASITEQTGGWLCLDLRGPDLPRLFEILCPLDTRAMQPGSGTRTVIEHLGCYVICLAPDQFWLFGPRSSALSLHHALVTAARAIA